MKFEANDSDCQRPALSPTFDIKESGINSGFSDRTTSKSRDFEEHPRNVKFKAEYFSGLSQPYQACGNDVDTVSTSTRFQRTPPIPPLCSSSIISKVITTTAPQFVHSNPTQHIEQTEPKVMKHFSKAHWNRRQNEVQELIKQRSQEWKKRQTALQLLRNSTHVHNSAPCLLGRKDPGSFTQEKGLGESTSNDFVPKSMFNWSTTPVLHHVRQSYRMNGYPNLVEYDHCDPQKPENSGSTARKRHNSELSDSEAEEARNGIGGEPVVIEKVFSLADKTSLSADEEKFGPGRCKRARKCSDGATYVERRETSGSVSSEGDIDSFNSSLGRYISDFEQSFDSTPDDHQVVHINGLLSLPSSKEKRYGITYGELKRRCNEPECLTRVDLVAYVRHSKSSGRHLLDKYNIVSSNRVSRPTILSKMCENEARNLGNGILRMNRDYFPDKLLAEIATSRLEENFGNDELHSENYEVEKKRKMREKFENILTTRSVLKEIFDLLHSEKDNEEMRKFELASHTFGIVNLRNHLTLFDRFFQQYQTSLMASMRS